MVKELSRFNLPASHASQMVSASTFSFVSLRNLYLIKKMVDTPQKLPKSLDFWGVKKTIQNLGDSF
jgi:hypothetical protein